jgi:hypothetical protein
LPSKGYGNLVQHIKSQQHTNWKSVVNDALNKNKNSLGNKIHLSPFSFVLGAMTLAPIISMKSKNYYGWLDLIISCNLPFKIVENKTFSKYINLSPICRSTFRTLLHGLSAHVKTIIKGYLPALLPIIFDGWDDGSGRYFIAVYTFRVVEGKNQYILLGMQPPPTLASYGAVDHKLLLKEMLEDYDKSLSSIGYLIGDNCSTNKALANTLNVPLIGCASHRLNLACKLIISEEESLLQKVASLMKLLSTKKRRARLRTLTNLRPKQRMAVRWSADYEIIKRYFELSPFIMAWPALDPELAGSLLTIEEEPQLKNLYEQLQIYNQVSMSLQTEPPPNLAAIRRGFDYLINQNSRVATKLGPEANIIHSPTFENALVKAINEDHLTSEEENTLNMFRNIEGEVPTPVNGLDSSSSEIEMIMSNKKRKVVKYDTEAMTLIPGTSNIVERLFSKVAHIYSSPRKSMDAFTLEDVVFLKENHSFWNVNTVNDLLAVKK